MNQYITYQLINTSGEISAIVFSAVTQIDAANIALRIMNTDRRIEQVGFITLQGTPIMFRMMGGELSVNGLAAGAFVAMKSKGRKYIRMTTNVLPDPIPVAQSGNRLTVTFPSCLVTSVAGPVVTLTGITYRMIPGKPVSPVVSAEQKKLLQDLTNGNKAAGLIYYSGSRIWPLLYVAATNTYIWEQSCGSGSIAYAVFSGKNRIRQPSGETVSVSITADTITYRVSAYIDTQIKEVSA